MLEDEAKEIVATLADQAVDELADLAAMWDGDTPTDHLARGMIGAIRPLIESLRAATHAEGKMNPLVARLATQMHAEMSRYLMALEALTMLRRKDD